MGYTVLLQLQSRRSYNMSYYYARTRYEYNILMQYNMLCTMNSCTYHK